MCTELGLPDGMRERSDESNALFWGEVGEEWIGDITKSNGRKEFGPDSEDAIELRRGVSLKSLGARPICIHKVSLEAMSVGSGEMEKFGGIWWVAE
jgi:hypothetical protein